MNDLRELIASIYVSFFLCFVSSAVSAEEHWAWSDDIDYEAFVELADTNDCGPLTGFQKHWLNFFAGPTTFNYGFQRSFGRGNPNVLAIATNRCDGDRYDHFIFCSSNGLLLAHGVGIRLKQSDLSPGWIEMFNSWSDLYLGETEGFETLWMGIDPNAGEMQAGLVHIGRSKESGVRQTSYYHSITKERADIVRFSTKYTGGDLASYCPNNGKEITAIYPRFGALHENLRVAAWFIDDYTSFRKAAHLCKNNVQAEAQYYANLLLEHEDLYGKLFNDLNSKVSFILNDLDNLVISNYYSNIHRSNSFEKFARTWIKLSIQQEKCRSNLNKFDDLWTIGAAQQLNKAWQFKD